MATQQECHDALQQVLAGLRSGQGPNTTGLPDRSLSCTVSDLGVVFVSALAGGQVGEISTIDPQQAAAKPAQIRMTCSSDDLIALAGKQLSLPAAWASGRVSIKANLFDLMALRSLA